MSVSNSTIPFEVRTVPLQGSNLIEASAGTGKTYSIAILALRLLLKGYSISEILMVTFTKAAVEELESRIRLFIRTAQQGCMGWPIEDETIKGLVEEAMIAEGKELTTQRLKNALLLLDETAILTIHSFCQRTLDEFAFETGQVFSAETMTAQDAAAVVEDQVNRFWRRYITTLELDLLKWVHANDFSRPNLIKVINLALGGKAISAPEKYTPGFLEPDAQKATVDLLGKSLRASGEKRQQLVEQLATDAPNVLARIAANKSASRYLKEYIQNGLDAEGLFSYLLDKSSKPADYLLTLFPDIFQGIQEMKQLEQSAAAMIHLYINKLYQFAIEEVRKGVEQVKEERNWISFDDMIQRLHQAVVVKRHPGLIAALQKKYKAAFIDEFQDTDKLQFELFDVLFGRSNLLFYIGDPKQSIYAFRKADIFTYFKAAQAVEHRYAMNTNFRSSHAIIRALNHFFLPVQDFDTFYFKDVPGGIQYVTVDPPAGNSKGGLFYNDKPFHPFLIQHSPNKEGVAFNVANAVVALLADKGYQLDDKGTRRNIKPSDIGILVRSRFEGNAVKEALSLYKIPAITIDETKILSTPVALEVQYILEAVYAISASSINKALLISLTGMTINDLLSIDEEQTLQRFKSYQTAWESEGVYVMLMRFMADYQVRSRLLNGDMVQGERILSNVGQLMELLHKMENLQQYAPVELLHWLQKGIQRDMVEGDEFEQRMESDEAAIKIVTIHKSKGLEYNIVMAPYLDMNVRIEDALLSFRDPNDEVYYFINKGLRNPAQEQWLITDAEQENRRLLYVALTRAKYACFINSNNSNKNNNSTLRRFVKALRDNETAALEAGIATFDAPIPDPGYTYDSGEPVYPVQYEKANRFHLLQPYWRKMSYSFLNPEHTLPSLPYASTYDSAYDQFIFKELKKGAHTGNLLHFIFERIDFVDPAYWETVVRQALKRLSSSTDDSSVQHLVQLLETITRVDLPMADSAIPTTIRLAEVSREQRLNELEFDFVAAPFSTGTLQQLAEQQAPFSLRHFNELEGIMNGKVDLFFEHGGKYYILDWKSNYLGDTLQDYDSASLQEAMTANNYHLQYHIYTVAVCKYLRFRLPQFDYDTHFGGVFYLFLRGVRKGKTTGIFYNRPSYALIQKLEALLSPSNALNRD